MDMSVTLWMMIESILWICITALSILGIDMPKVSEHKHVFFTF